MQASFLFDNLSATYDSVNAIMSLGLDNLARKKAIQNLNLKNSQEVLDLFTGTGNNVPFLFSVNSNLKVDALDTSAGMIKAKRDSRIVSKARFIHADFLTHNFYEKKYDAIICSYGLKCIPDKLLKQYLSKLEQILKPHGELVFLDIIKSDTKVLNLLFAAYFKLVLRLHPKVNQELRSQYLQLLVYMSSFNIKAFNKCVAEMSSIQMTRLPINIPMIRAYKITKV